MSIDVLLVDEDQDVLDIVSTFLGREPDLSVTTETDPEAALERALDGEFDAVVSDYRMPRMSGVELCDAIREAGNTIPFMLFSARERDEVEAELESAGVTEFVQKGTGTDQYTVLAEYIRDAV